MNYSRVLITVICSFIIYSLYMGVFFQGVKESLYFYFNQLSISHIVASLISLVPILGGTFFIKMDKRLFQSVGFDGSFYGGTWVAFLFTLPMLIGYAIFFEYNNDLTLNKILISAVSAAFFEEVVFRGFLFGQIHRNTKLGFISSVFVGALIFALVHLYQSENLLELAGIFVVTLVGGFLFAWVYTEWNYNIWIPIQIHFFMNLFWMLFSAGDNALGGGIANIFRFATILLVIFGTVFYKKRKGVPLVVTREGLLFKPYNS